MSSRSTENAENALACIIRMLKAVAENQNRMQKTIEDMAVEIDKINVKLNESAVTTVSISGDGLFSSNDQAQSIMKLIESLTEEKINELIQNDRILGERSVGKPKLSKHTEKIRHVLKENLIQFKKLYLQHLAAGGEEREDHEDIVNFEPLSETLDASLITQAYKNVMTITRLYILNNIYYPAGKKLLWRDLSSIDCLKHALSLEYILCKSEFPGVALHHCTEQWSCRNILTEKMRSMQTLRRMGRLNLVVLLNPDLFLKLRPFFSYG